MTAITIRCCTPGEASLVPGRVCISNTAPSQDNALRFANTQTFSSFVAQDTTCASETVEKAANPRKPRKKNPQNASCSIPESTELRCHILESGSPVSSPSTRRKRANSNSLVSTSKSSNSTTTLGSESKPVSPYASLPPLPATQHFLSKLKGKRKRQRQNSFEELQYGMPIHLTINHIGIFFHAAMRFERQHAFFLHVCLQTSWGSFRSGYVLRFA